MLALTLVAIAVLLAVVGLTWAGYALSSRRQRQQTGRLRALAASAQLDPEFAEKFLNFIISEVIRHHEAFRD